MFENERNTGLIRMFRAASLVLFLACLTYTCLSTSYRASVSILMPEPVRNGADAAQKISPYTEFKIIKGEKTFERVQFKLSEARSSREVDIEAIRRGLDFGYNADTRIFELTLYNKSRQFAMKAVNAVAEAYVENYVSNVNSFSGKALDNLYMKQMAYKKELAEANGRYEKLCRSEKIINLDNELAVLTNQYTHYNSELTVIAADIELAEKLARDRAAARAPKKDVRPAAEVRPPQVRRTPQVMVECDNELSRELKRRIGESEIKLAWLKRKYTDEHPAVKNEAALLDILRKKFSALPKEPAEPAFQSIQPASETAKAVAAPRRELPPSDYNLELLYTKKNTYSQLLAKCEEAIKEFPKKKSVVKAYEVEITKVEEFLSKINKQIEDTILYQARGIDNAPSVIDFCRDPGIHLPWQGAAASAFALLMFIASFAAAGKAGEMIAQKKASDFDVIFAGELNYRVLGHISGPSPMDFDDPAFSPKCFAYHQKESRNSRTINLVRNSMISQIEKEPSNIIDSSAVVAVTSLNAGEGKTVVAANLAVSSALSGIDTLAVDFNYKTTGEPLAKLFKRDPQCGVTDIVVGETPYEEVLTDTGLDPLKFIHTGMMPPSVQKVASSPVMEKFLKEASGKFQLIVADCPAFSISGDLHSLSKYLKNIVLVVNMEKNRDAAMLKEELKGFDEFVKNSNLHLLGVVINEK